MSKLKLNDLKIQSFVTQAKQKGIKGGISGCPYVCLGAADFTRDPNGCLSYPQFICDDPYGVTTPHSGC